MLPHVFDLFAQADTSPHRKAGGLGVGRLAGTAQLDVYIIDIGLPDMDGFEVARRLRELPAGRKAVLVALRGYGSPRDKARAHDAGFDVHVTKPADAERLHVLNSRSSRDADA